MFPAFEPVNAYIALVAVLVNLTLAAWVILRSTRSHVYLTFMFVCLSVAFWNFGDFMIYASGHSLWPEAGAGHPSPWKYYSSTGSSMAVAFLFHFMCALVRSVRRRQGWIMLGYVVGGFFAVTSPMAIYYEPIKGFVDGTAWNILFGLLLVPFLAAGMLMLAVALVRAETADERSRWLFTLTAIAITVLAGLTDLVQKLQVPIPPLGHIGSVVGPTILAIGIVRHRKVFDVLTRTRMRLGAMSEMAAGIAHEIRNPLTAMKGAAALQADEIEGGRWQEAEKYRGIIDEEVKRLEQILESFRDFTKPIELEKERRSVNELLERTVSLARMGDPGIELAADLEPGIPECDVDPALLRQVFINFIRNASEACGEGGTLRISTSWKVPWICIDFQDNGPGLPMELSNRIFEPFFTTKKEGIGVGLSICRRIVEAHSGRIEVVAGPGKGAHFRVSLPGAA